MLTIVIAQASRRLTKWTAGITSAPVMWDESEWASPTPCDLALWAITEFPSLRGVSVRVVPQPLRQVIPHLGPLPERSSSTSPGFQECSEERVTRRTFAVIDVVEILIHWYAGRPGGVTTRGVPPMASAA